MNAWILLSLIATLTWAAMPLVTERHKGNVAALLVWMRAFAFPIPALLLTFVYGWPTDPVFYAITGGGALLWLISDLTMFRCVQQIGAAVPPRILPVANILAFFLWLPLAPTLVGAYLDQPLRAVGIFACIVLSVWFTLKLRHCEISSLALRALWPAILVNGVGPILSRLALDRVDLTQGVLAYIAVQSVVVAPLMLLYLRQTVGPAAFSRTLMLRSTLFFGIIFGLLQVIHNVGKQAAFVLAEHPVYVSVITLTAPILISGVYWLTGRKDDSDKIAGFGLLACAMALILLKTV